MYFLLLLFVTINKTQRAVNLTLCFMFYKVTVFPVQYRIKKVFILTLQLRVLPYFILLSKISII